MNCIAFRLVTVCDGSLERRLTALEDPFDEVLKVVEFMMGPIIN